MICVATASSADVTRISEENFEAGSGLIGFDEPGFSLGTTNPSYAPSDYGGGPEAPNVDFGGYFQGQSLSDNPSVDCPGAAASACISGSPTGPLSLDPDSPVTEIVTDGANPTSPVLSGTPIFNGPISVLFDTDLAGVGFDGGFFNAVESTGITAFDRSGSVLGTVTNEEIGIEFLGLVTEGGAETIAGVALDLVGSEPAGFAIDNLRFGEASQIDIPDDPSNQVPVPATLGLLALGLAVMGMNGSRRRNFG